MLSTKFVTVHVQGTQVYPKYNLRFAHATAEAFRFGPRYSFRAPQFSPLRHASRATSPAE
jgi:hypothetical protein